MNTKFDVGQRVTYPVVHTADGNVTGIAVSKTGVTRYAIGAKWYAEKDLKLAAEENPVTEPVKEREPVKLYCIESYRPGEWLTKGKIYELDVDGTIHYDDGYSKRFYDVRKNSSARRNLVPLVKRPAKVGEWVYVLERGTSRYEEKRIYKVFDTGSNSCVWFADDRKGNIPKENYLVLDGYTGDPA